MAENVVESLRLAVENLKAKLISMYGQTNELSGEMAEVNRIMSLIVANQSVYVTQVIQAKVPDTANPAVPKASLFGAK